MFYNYSSKPWWPRYLRNPADLTVNTITADTGNFDVINVATLNVSDPTDATIQTDLNVSSITATTGNIENLTADGFTSSSATISSSIGCNSLNSQTLTSNYLTANEILKVSNNCMIINDTNINSNTEFLGDSAKTVGDYLTELYPESTSTYALEQLAAGDNGSFSIILTSGGSYGTDKNSIQSYNSYRDKKLDLYLNPLGGKVILNEFKPVNQIMGAAAYMIKPNFACSTFICTIKQFSSDGVDNDQDQDVLWCINPGFKIIVYQNSDFSGTSTEFDNIDGLYPIYENGSQDATSIQIFYNNIEINPFGF